MILIKAKNYCTPWWLYTLYTFPTPSELDDLGEYETCDWTVWPKYLLSLFVPVNQHDEIIRDRERYCECSYDWKYIRLSKYESSRIKRESHVIKSYDYDYDYPRGRSRSVIRRSEDALVSDSIGIYDGFLSINE